MTDTPLTEFILSHASRRLPIFATLPDDPDETNVELRHKNAKKPHPVLAINGFRSATTDYEALKAHPSYDPRCNVALEPGAQDWVVLDFDVKNGGLETRTALEAELGLLPKTYTVQTPTGGFHYYFKGPMQSRNGARPGLDIKSVGGYVLLPPSRTVHGDYRVVEDRPLAELPAAWREALEHKKREPAKATPGVELGTPDQVAQFVHELKGRRPAIEGQGGDESTYKIAPRAKELGLTEDQCFEAMLEHYNPRCTPPWDPDELRVKVANGYRYAQNEAGSRAGDAEPVTEWAKRLVPAEVLGEPEPAGDECEARFRRLSLTAWATLPAIEYLDPYRVLPRYVGGAVGFLIAPSHEGKSTLALHLALEAISRGHRVLYLAGEGAHGLGQRRIPAEAAVRNVTLADLERSLFLDDVVPRLSDEQAVRELVRAYADVSPALVIWDTLATAIPGLEENSATTASLFTGNGPVRTLIGRTWGATNLVLHHTGKDPTKKGRGSSGFEANGDFTLLLSANKSVSTAKVHVDKMRDGPSGHDVFFRVSGAGGAPVASSITAAEHAALGPTAPNSTQRPVLDALKELWRPGGPVITTHVLADKLTPPAEGERLEDREKRIKKRELALTRWVRPSTKTGKPGPLLAYVRWDADGDPVSPYEWQLPDDLEAEDD